MDWRFSGLDSDFTDTLWHIRLGHNVNTAEVISSVSVSGIRGRSQSVYASGRAISRECHVMRRRALICCDIGPAVGTRLRGRCGVMDESCEIIAHWDNV